MKKIQKNDLRLEKEVISKLSQDDLTFVKGGATLGVTCVKTDGCVHPISYDNKCQTVNMAASCMVSCGGGCTVKSVNIACEVLTKEPGCELKPISEGGESVCYCVAP